MTNERQNEAQLKDGDVVSLDTPKIKKYFDWSNCSDCARSCEVGDYIFPFGTTGIVMSKHRNETKGLLFDVYLFESCPALGRVIEATSNQLQKIGTCKVSINTTDSCEDCQIRYQCLVNNWGLPKNVTIREHV